MVYWYRYCFCTKQGSQSSRGQRIPGKGTSCKFQSQQGENSGWHAAHFPRLSADSICLRGKAANHSPAYIYLFIHIQVLLREIGQFNEMRKFLQHWCSWGRLLATENIRLSNTQHSGLCPAFFKTKYENTDPVPSKQLSVCLSNISICVIL